MLTATEGPLAALTEKLAKTIKTAAAIGDRNLYMATPFLSEQTGDTNDRAHPERYVVTFYSDSNSSVSS